MPLHNNFPADLYLDVLTGNLGTPTGLGARLKERKANPGRYQLVTRTRYMAQYEAQWNAEALAWAVFYKNAEVGIFPLPPSLIVERKKHIAKQVIKKLKGK